MPGKMPCELQNAAASLGLLVRLGKGIGDLPVPLSLSNDPQRRDEESQ